MAKIPVSRYVQAVMLIAACLSMAWCPLAKAGNIETSFVAFLLNGQKIAGTLTRPTDRKNPPIVLILHGMGGNRLGPPITGDGRGLFVRTAQLLAEAGIASLSISTRGKDGSDGDFRNMTLERRTQEALRAIEWISDQQKFDNSKISILGHSQGTLIAVSAASRLSPDDIVDSIILWAPQSDALKTYRASMGLKIYNKGFSAKPGEVVSWRGAGNRRRSFRTGFFRGLATINTLAEIASFTGRLLIITGKYDRWSTSINARKIQAHHQGDHAIAEFNVAHRMGASIGLKHVDKVIFHSLAWLQSASKQ